MGLRLRVGERIGGRFCRGVGGDGGDDGDERGGSGGVYGRVWRVSLSSGGECRGATGGLGGSLFLRFVCCGWWREGALRTWDAVSNDVYLPTL